MERGEGREKRRDITRSFPHIRRCEIVRVRRALEKVTDGVAGGVTVGAEVAVRALPIWRRKSFILEQWPDLSWQRTALD